jgi:uncharacterized lipoprotein YmbA
VQVTALARVHDDRVQLWQRTFTAEQKVETGDEAEALAAALSRALAQVAAQITEQTVQALAQAETHPSPASSQAAPAAVLSQPTP